MNDIPIVGQSVFVVCRNGHVNEAPQHTQAAFKNDDGSTEQAVLCGRCQFEFFASAFGGVLLPRSTTRKEADWKAKEMREAQAAAIAEEFRKASGQAPPEPVKAS